MLTHRSRTVTLVAVVGVATLAASPAHGAPPPDAPPAESPAPAIGARSLERLDPLDRDLLDELTGHAPPAITDELTWPAGEPLVFPSLRGRVVVLQSWTSRTAAGRAMPVRMHRALSDFGPADVQLIALHTPEGADTAATFLERRPMEVPVVIDPTGAFCDALGVYRKPVNIVIDRQGAVRYAGVKLQALPEVVRSLVAEPFDAEAAPPAPRPEKTMPAAEFPAFHGSVGRATDLRGREAPPFYVQQWLTAAPNASEKVTVVEFWATWCGPCRTSIPHLNSLASEFADHVVVIGVSKEDAGKVRTFMGSTPMRYHVASDPSGRMNDAVGVQGIPHALVMSRDWIVRWQGHPASLTPAVLHQVIAADGGGADRRRLRWTSG